MRGRFCTPRGTRRLSVREVWRSTRVRRRDLGCARAERSGRDCEYDRLVLACKRTRERLDKETILGDGTDSLDVVGIHVIRKNNHVHSL